jgi:hypothetical protein
MPPMRRLSSPTSPPFAGFLHLGAQQMATELLASATTAVSSADIVVAAGSFEPVFLKDAAGPDTPIDAMVLIEIKDSAGQYFTIGKLNRHNASVLLTGPATYRVTRPVQLAAVGVEKGS